MLISTFLNHKSGVNCRSDGLCADAGNDTLYRTACTDQTWQSPECINLCINGTNQAGNDVPVMQCSDGSYCCGNKVIAMACCNGGQGVWIVHGEETRVNPSATPSSSLSSTNTSSSVTEVAALAPNTTASISLCDRRCWKKWQTQLRRSEALLGVVIGLALILGACWFFFVHRRRKAPKLPPKSDVRWPEEMGDNSIREAWAPCPEIKRNELAGLPVSRPQLDKSTAFYELDHQP